MQKTLLAMLLAASLIAVPVLAEAKTYTGENFSFEYPNGCKLEKKENRFTTSKASLECKGEVGLNVEYIDSSILSLEEDSELLDNMETTFGSLYDNVDIVLRSDEEGAKQYIINNQTAPYIQGSYDQVFYTLFGGERTEPWALMAIYVKLSPTEFALVQYRNEADDFDDDLDIAEKVFESISPTTS